MAEASTINRAQTAVLIMDDQHDIVSNVEASSPGLLDRAASVLSAARRAGMPVLAQWQAHFPGLVSEPSSLGVGLRLPPALELGHERQFALVLNTFLDHLDRGTWPQALPARIRMRYTLLAQAQDLGRRQRQGASSYVNNLPASEYVP